MLLETIALLALPLANCVVDPPAEPIPISRVAAANYEVRIRFEGRVTTTQVRASDAGHARRLAQAQFGPKVTVLSVKRID